MNQNWVLLESYLNHLTDGGRKFFSRLVTEAFEVEFYDGLRIIRPGDRLDFHFWYDPLTKTWLASSDDLEPMNMISFCSLIQSCSFDESFEFIRGLFFPSPIGNSNGWPIPIKLASQKPVSLNKLSDDALADIPEETLRKIREDQKRDWEEYQRSLEPTDEQYETTPEEALQFYFRIGNKQNALFWRASDIVKFMNSLHPGFWKLPEEETGKLLNSEFAVCKGRKNGAHGYFLQYRDGFKPGVYLDLKRAS